MRGDVRCVGNGHCDDRHNIRGNTMRTIIQSVIADLEREAVIPVGGITVTKESAPCDNHPKREPGSGHPPICLEPQTETGAHG